MNASLTAMGWIVVPCTLLLVYFQREMLLPWTAFLSVFQAASAVNITLSGSYPIGIQPGMFAAMVTCVVLALFSPAAAKARLRLSALNWIYLALLIFAAYAVASSYFIPARYAGRLYVYPPRAGLDIRYTAPLQFSNTNISQDMYLILMATFFVVVCEFILFASDGSRWRNVLNGWMMGGVAAALVGVYQILASRLGLHYPYEFFNSNKGYAQGYQEQVANLSRLSGTFTEPSVASAFFCGVGAYATWRLLHGRGTRLTWLTSLLSAAALLLTTSSTAYLTACVVVLVVGASVALRTRFSMRMVVSVLVLLVLATGVAAILVRNAGVVTRVWREEITNKSLDRSYIDRAASNTAAWQVVRDTDGFGVGWGSTRASSLAFNLLANAGMIGSLALMGCFVGLMRMVRRARNCVRGEPRAELDALLVALGAMLVAALVAVPDLMQLSLWLAAALLAGLAARINAVAPAPA